jgi:hypothetical protein
MGLQHQNLLSNVNNNTGHIIQEVNSVDKHLSDGVLELNNTIGVSGSRITDAVGAQSLGIRDAVERTATNLSSQTAGSIRDVQVAVERNGFNAMNSSERVGSNILSAVERTAGETRLSNAVLDATNRQSTNDLARDIINQGNRDASNIQKSITDNQYSNLLSDASNRQTSNDIARDVISRINDTSTNVALAVEKTGSAMQILQHANGYETRTLVNSDEAEVAYILIKICNNSISILYELLGLATWFTVPIR